MLAPVCTLVIDFIKSRLEMQESPVYVNNFKIFNFDTRSIQKRYRLVTKSCDIEINENVKKLIDFIKLNEGSSFDYIVETYHMQSGVDKENIGKIILLLFEKGVLSNEKREV